MFRREQSHLLFNHFYIHLDDHVMTQAAKNRSKSGRDASWIID